MEKEDEETLVSVRGLTKRYGPLTALEGLDLDVRRGEIFGLLGPNGAGKTTTLECILGTRASDAGVVRLLGQSPEKDRKTLFERVGVQFQASSYPDRIRVKEMCRLTAGLYRSVPEWKTLLDRFSLAEKSHSYVADLSGGERQKLSVVLALIHRPEVVFLDELTTGLDPLARREVWNYLLRLREEGLTIFLTSHYMDEVTFLCDRICILDRGQTVAEGTPADVVRQTGAANLEEAYIYHIQQRESADESADCTV